MSKKLNRRKIRRDVLRLLKNNGKKSYRPKELAQQLDFTDNQDYRLFRDVLTEMDEQDAIGRVKGGRYTYKPRPTKVEGVLSVNPKGFGFVAVEGMDEDLFVNPSNLLTALDGDRVLVGMAAPAKGEGRREAEVLEVVERGRKQTVGTFKQRGHFAFVEADDKRLTNDIYVPKEHFNGAKSGDKVVVSIDQYDDPHASPEGRVLQVIGSSEDPDVRVLSLALSLDVKSGFSEATVQEAEAVKEAIPKKEIGRRLDLREKAIFTIDPFDAKDFDDAIHIEELPNGNYEVGVHIADVSHYVRPGSALDEEAYERGTSVYLVDRTIPMLPEKLSNKVCSLRPREDKLTYSCILELSKRGTLKGYEIRETVIHSKERFTYEEAQTLIEGGRPDHPLAGDVVKAARLARALTKNRMRSGSVDFDLPEIKVILNDDGSVKEIIRKERKEANRLIEEFMLMANQAVAMEIGKRRKAPPYVYRIHDRPDAERIQKLGEYIRAFGYELKLDDGNIQSTELNRLLGLVKGSPEAPVIEQAALRSMAKAVYSTNNVGHYGLGFRFYTHFTSPIRRYPDLMVHRLLKRYLGEGGAKVKVDEEELQARCEHCSGRERVATEAERESVKLKQVEYVQQHLGETFAGVVSGVTKFGVFVELSDLLVEGMVHVRDMDDDYYEYDEANYRLVGQYANKSYRLGDRVDVTVASANPERREVDLLFTD